MPGWWRSPHRWMCVILIGGCGRLRFEAVGRDGGGADGCTVGCPSAACDAVGGTPATNGLVLYWKLDETSGDVAYDSTSSGINGAPYSHLWHPNAGVVDGAIEVPMGAGGPDGTNSLLDAVDATMTFAVWLKDAGTPTTAFHNLISKVDFTANPLEGWAFQSIDGTRDIQLRVDTTAGQNQTTSGFVNALDGQWHHLAFTLDTGKRVTYFDGATIGNDAYAHGQGFGNPGVLVCGTDNATAAFYDEVRYYDRALGPDEISSLVNLNAPRLRDGWTRADTGGLAATSLDLPAAAGVEPGDLVVIVFTVDRDALMPVALSDFMVLTTAEQTGRHIAVFYKIAGAVEPASYRVTWNAAAPAIGYALRITRADARDPFGPRTSTVGDSDPATFDPFPTSGANALVIAAVSTPASVSACGAAEWDPPFSRVDCHQNGTSNGASIGFRVLGPADALASPTFTFPATSPHASALFEIRAAPCGP